VELGYRHRSDAVLADAGDVETWEDPATPSARPGFRAPHVPLAVDGAEESTLDLFGRDFVLLAGADGERWCAAAGPAGESLGVSVQAYRLDADVRDAAGSLETVYGTGPDGAMLVRPDGIVAWRTSGSVPDPEAELSRALGAALGRGAAVTAG